MSRMVHVVLVYHRESGRLHREETFDDSHAAMRRRFGLERLPEYADMEVVVLSAESEATLRETHGRYFFTMEELLQRFRDAADRVA